MSVILGINAMHAGAAAAVVVEGRPVIALAEERLNRVKYYARFPSLAIQRCLEVAGLGWRDVDAVAVGRDASANRAQKLRYVASHPTRLLNLMKIRSARSSLESLRDWIARECEVDPASLRFTQHNVEHHLAHTASTCSRPSTAIRSPATSAGSSRADQALSRARSDTAVTVCC